MIDLLRLDHVLITIPENTRQEAVQFYTETLLLNEIPGPHPNDAIWIELGNIELHIREEAGHQVNSARHVALVVKDLKDAQTFLKNKAITVTFSSVIPGRDRCFFRDPWGNRFELIRYDEH